MPLFSAKSESLTDEQAPVFTFADGSVASGPEMRIHHITKAEGPRTLISTVCVNATGGPESLATAWAKLTVAVFGDSEMPSA